MQELPAACPQTQEQHSSGKIKDSEPSVAFVFFQQIAANGSRQFVILPFQRGENTAAVFHPDQFCIAFYQKRKRITAGRRSLIGAANLYGFPGARNRKISSGACFKFYAAPSAVQLRFKRPFSPFRFGRNAKRRWTKNAYDLARVVLDLQLHRKAVRSGRIADFNARQLQRGLGPVLRDTRCNHRFIFQHVTLQTEDRFDYSLRKYRCRRRKISESFFVCRFRPGSALIAAAHSPRNKRQRTHGLFFHSDGRVCCRRERLHI